MGRTAGVLNLPFDEPSAGNITRRQLKIRVLNARPQFEISEA